MHQNLLMRRYYRFILIALCFCSLPAVAQKQKIKSSPDKASLFNQYISAAMPLWKIPGMSVVVVKDGKVAFTKGYGVAQLGKGEAFTPNTASICASTTKAMTAVCMAMLVDEGKVKWSDKVADVYPALKLKDAYANSEVTIKDLFTHNAGLGNGDFLWELRYNTDEIIRRMRYIEPSYSMRSSFEYQNLMYIVAGEVIHALSGKSWEDFITERLFKPLSMNRTYALYSRLDKSQPHIATHLLSPDSVVQRIDYPLSNIGAPGGVWSTAEDMGKWLLFLLDSTKLNGKALLKPETYAQLFRPQALADGYTTQAVVKPHWNTYGLGWFQHDYRGGMLQYHTGSLPGAVAIAALIPEQQFGIYIFENLDHAELRHALVYKAIDLWCFGDNSRDWSKELFTLYADLHKKDEARKDERKKQRVTSTKPSLQLTAYTGSYESELYGPVTVSLVKDSLQLQFPGDNLVRLSHWHYDTFLGKSNNAWEGDWWMQFFLNRDGKVGELNVDGIVYKKKEK